MARVKTLLYSCILPAAAVFAVAFGYEKASQSSMQYCNQQFALCTSAKCIPQPGDETKAICICDVEDGPSLATVPCKTLRPNTDANGIRTVYSTFSLKQYVDGKKAMKCPSGTPWTWCLNKRCTVDPADPKKAICICDVMRTGEWTTLGGNCDTTTCETSYWSGASLEDNKEGSAFLIKELGLKKSPVKWCEEHSP